MTPQEVENISKKLENYFSVHSQEKLRSSHRISSRKPVGRGIRKRNGQPENPNEIYDDQILLTRSLI